MQPVVWKAVCLFCPDIVKGKSEVETMQEAKEFTGNVKGKLKEYEDYLFQKELSGGTISIYKRQAELLLTYLDGRPVTRKEMIAYKNHLIGQNRKVSTTNLHIVAANSYIKYAGYADCTIRTCRLQKNRCLENVISMEEYRRILLYTKESGRMKYYYIMKALAFTGMRVSELSFLTVEVLAAGKFAVDNKGKTRYIYLSTGLTEELSAYCREEKIESGVIFMGKNKNPISRIAVYKMLIHLADLAGIEKKKAHPHSFRHLFAVTYMNQYANLTELADLLGHSSLETTRIYTVTTAEEKRKRLDGLGF